MKIFAKSVPLAALCLLSACASAPASSVMQAADAPPDAFLAALRNHCGQAFAGRVLIDTPASANDAFAGKSLVMHVRECAHSVPCRRRSFAHLGADPHCERHPVEARSSPRRRHIRQGDDVRRRHRSGRHRAASVVSGGWRIHRQFQRQRPDRIDQQHVGDGDRTRPPLSVRTLAPQRPTVSGPIRSGPADTAAASALGRHTC